MNELPNADTETLFETPATPATVPATELDHGMLTLAATPEAQPYQPLLPLPVNQGEAKEGMVLSYDSAGTRWVNLPYIPPPAVASAPVTPAAPEKAPMFTLNPPEKSRTYYFEGGRTLTFHDVTKIGTRGAGHTHRLETAAGEKWIVPGDWTHIGIVADDWTL